MFPNIASARGMQMLLVAQKFYIDGKSKSEIAEDLKLSRFKVARLLEQAIEDGVVEIRLIPPVDIDLAMGSALERKYRLSSVLVASNETTDIEQSRDQIGRIAAMDLQNVLSDGDVVGIAWGRTMDAMVRAVWQLPRCSFVQMVGGVHTSSPAMDSMDLVRRLAEASGGTAFPLYAPLIVADTTTARRLAKDPLVHKTLEKFNELTHAVVGIGSWNPPDSSVRDMLAPDIVAMEDEGAVADVCATVLDADGHPVLSTRKLSERSLSISWERLSKVPHVVAVAGGVDKADAIRAVITSGIIHTLVTDVAAARRLLDTIPGW
jgi:DNA-binding transcriptional regulator LsrR (DeoR family)